MNLVFADALGKALKGDANGRDDLIIGSEADKSCPVVVGAVSRFALHYVDPKISDGTVTEDATYDERCRQIATEMFYLVSQVKKRTAASSRD